jgi:hypothetical protein
MLGLSEEIDHVLYYGIKTMKDMKSMRWAV